MKCPYCNSPVLLNDFAGNPWYKCGTTKTFRSASCVDREPLATELRNAQDRIKRLEDAGNRLKDRYILENENWDLQTVNDWNDAKEDKP